jgi:segregation and condensation protein B
MVERALATAASATVTSLSPEDRRHALRVVEAVIFASAEPVAVEALAERLPDRHDIEGLLRELQQAYAGRGVNLVQVAGKWAFRTAEDLSFLLSREVTEPRRLSRAAMETLAIVAYHQPVTRAEIEDIRGVMVSRGTLDVLLETGWIRMRGRRRAPGRPITYGVTDAFLEHFGLNSVADLPGLDELRGAGLLEGAPAAFAIPEPRDLADLAEDEDPLADDDPGTDIL